ncbi:MAG: hypothetical protein QM778_19990 [Myxococcales bacterium]
MSLFRGFLGLTAVAAWSSVLGCGENDSPAGADKGDQQGNEQALVTWHQHVAPVITEKCTACHTEGGIAPFSLTSYANAKAVASQVAAAVMEGRMPPYLAQETPDCQPRLHWANDLRLSAEQKTMIQTWVDNGTPEGDPATAAEIKHPAPVALPREDIVMNWPEAIAVDGTKDIHTCIIVDPQLTADSYVTGRLITSGNKKVLHHVVSYVIAPGQNADGTPRTKAQLEEAVKAQKGVGIGGRYDCFGGAGFQSGGGVSTEMLDAWAPGGVANLAPEDSGQPVLKDSLVLLDVHYHPTGKPEVDSGSKLSLMLSQTRPSRISRSILLGNFTQPESAPYTSMYGDGMLIKQPDETEAKFLIPANAKDHVEEMTWTWKALSSDGLRVMGMGTHMHYVGRGMRITLERANGDSECLIETPRYDFNWQRGYGYDAAFEQLPMMGVGDTLRMRCIYDNSMDNNFVRQALDDQGLDAPVDVPLGEDTLNEMCLGAVGIIYPNLTGP